MKKQDFIRKISSRKLWLAVSGFISGLILAFGGSDTLANTIGGCVLQGFSILGYILAETIVDANRCLSTDSEEEEE